MYARSLIVFSLALLAGAVCDPAHPGHPAVQPAGLRLGALGRHFNTASSFVTNTNWQYYGGETTLSYFAQMAGLTVQNFVSAAVGIGVAGRDDPRHRRPQRRRASATSGRTWSAPSTTSCCRSRSSAPCSSSPRGSSRPSAAVTSTTLEGANQTLALGPVASQIAIKQLGTNGGGFFNVNSAMPFENPTRSRTSSRCCSIILIPAALTYTYGRMVGRQRQGWAIFAAMLIAVVGFVARHLPGRAARHARPARGRRAHRRDRRLDRRQHGGQGAAKRDRRVGALGGDHDGDLQRLGQLRDRVLHRHRRRGADVRSWPPAR